jgi:hypothetical protein
MPLPAWVLPAAIGSVVGGGLSQIGKGGGGVKQVANRFGQLEGPLTNFFAERIGEPGPVYPGELVAPLSEYETRSFDFLRKYGDTGYGPTYAAGQKQIQDTLEGNYNPANSPYYQAVKAEAAKNLQDTQKNIASNAAGGGRYFSGARIKQQGEAASEMERSLNTLLGNLAQQERQNQLSVLPAALQYGQAAPALDLQKSAVFQELGALPRNIQQMFDTANQQQWQQSEVDYPLQIAQMVGSLLTGNQPVYQQNSPSAISQLLGGVGQGVGNIGTLLLLQSLLK